MITKDDFEVKIFSHDSIFELASQLAIDFALFVEQYRIEEAIQRQKRFMIDKPKFITNRGKKL
jgi:hypothetical protein